MTALPLPPDVVYHYTNTAGLFGILTSGQLHLDDVAEAGTVYAAHFCEEGDLLSRWLEYDDEGGYALGFRSGAFQQLQACEGTILKPSSVREEREWRLAIDTSVCDDDHAPYRTVRFRIDGVASVTVGPGRYPKMRLAAVRRLLDKLGMSYVEVRRSAVPFRARFRETTATDRDHLPAMDPLLATDHFGRLRAHPSAARQPAAVR
ncbi:hypothetical protein AB0J80_31875 [Actinoplanes sp. NPDC049548]|uniref:hypothetical protein n=1 Tax=Actinoplanes sp. NPDC049548 TaxID=3155152 RepID=UPI00342BF008